MPEAAAAGAAGSGALVCGESVTACTRGFPPRAAQGTQESPESATSWIVSRIRDCSGRRRHLGGVTASDPDLDSLLDHLPWVRKLALQLCSDAHRAEDAAQEACLLAAQRPPRDAGKFKGYLARILRNVLHRDGRAQRRRNRREHAFATLRQVETDDPIELVARAELHGALVAAVLELPEAQRQVVLLHHFEGLEVAEVARRVGRSADAVRALLRRAREDLRGALERRDTRFAAALLSLGSPAAPLVSTSLVLTAIAMKTKLFVTAALAAALCVSIPFFGPGSSGGSAPEPVPASSAAAGPAVHSPSAGDAVAAAAAVERVVAPQVGRHLHGALVGLDARAPWTAPLTIVATWRRGDEVARDEIRAAVSAEGTFDATLARWDGECAGLRIELSAADAWYEPLEQQIDLGDAARDLFEVPVMAAPILIGGVAAPDGSALSGVEVLCFAAGETAPRGPCLTDVRCAADGTWRVRLPENGPTLVVVLPPDGREDLVVAGHDVAVRGVTDVGALRLEPASAVSGVVRWRTGAPVEDAQLSWRTRTAVTLDKGRGLSWNEGRVQRRRTVRTDRDGRFAIRVAAGEQGSVLVERAAGFLPSGFTMQKATAPAEVELVVEGRPVTIRVLRDGAPAGPCGVEWRRERFAGNYGTDEQGVLRQLVLEEPVRMRAVSRDREWASEWAEFGAAVPDEVVLQLLPLDGERVVVQLAAVDLEQASFQWTAANDPAARRSFTLRRQDGAFVMRVPAGSQRLRVIGVRGTPSELLLPTEIEVTLPAPGDVIVPARLGGRLRLAVTDAQGAFLGGRYRLTGSGGAAEASPQHALQAGAEHFTPVVEPGTYELVLDLGERGETRRTVEIAAGRTTDVSLVVP